MIDQSIDICWWETSLTDHQAFTLVELKNHATLSVFVVRHQNEERKNQGWVSSIAASLSPMKLPDWNPNFIWRTIYSNRKKVHVFGGPFEHPKLMLAAFLGILTGTKVYFLSEPYSTATHGLLKDNNKQLNIFKAKLRPILYSLYGKIFLKYIKGVLAVSPLAAKQFILMGAKRSQIFPFGYFVPAVARQLVSRASDRLLKAVFVGTLNGTKGIDILSSTIHSLNLEGYKIGLDVFGPGDQGILGDKPEGVRYCGIIPFGEAQRVISSYDLFILPSRYDGWGVVVNEAILAGIPVLCSDRVGASAIVKNFGCGKVYELSDPAALIKILISFIFDPSQLDSMRQAIPEAQRALDPKLAADYIMEMIQASDNNSDQINSCPWYEIS
jgi:glycosyltransferase involved in cell wall biosynthesis